MSQHVEIAAGEFLQIDSLVNSLQLERGTAASYISSEGSNQGALYQLWEIHDDTGAMLHALSKWPSDVVFRDRKVVDQEDFLTILNEIRQNVTFLEITQEECITVYTEINTVFMDIATEQTRISGPLWSYLVSASAMIRASDAMGVQRALGAIYFTVCSMSKTMEELFIRMQEKASTQEALAFLYTPDYKKKWLREKSNAGGSSLDIHKSRINTQAHYETCMAQTEEKRFEDALVWFSDMTTYINDWKMLRDELLMTMKSKLASQLSKQKREVALYTLLICIIFLLFLAALVFSIMYAHNMKILTTKIARFATQVGPYVYIYFEIDDEGTHDHRPSNTVHFPALMQFYNEATVAQTRHFIKHLLHDFTKHLLHDFTISSTILQFPPRFYNFLHDFTIFATILQFPPRFYNFLHDFTISSTI